MTTSVSQHVSEYVKHRFFSEIERQHKITLFLMDSSLEKGQTGGYCHQICRHSVHKIGSYWILAECVTSSRGCSRKDVAMWCCTESSAQNAFAFGKERPLWDLTYLTTTSKSFYSWSSSSSPSTTIIILIPVGMKNDENEDPPINSTHFIEKTHWSKISRKKTPLKPIIYRGSLKWLLVEALNVSSLILTSWSEPDWFLNQTFNGLVL